MNVNDLKDLVTCEWCGSVLDKNFLSPTIEPLNDYRYPVFDCPCCNSEVFDHNTIKDN